MLTRIEIDGFKSFRRFGLDLRPLTAVVGPNASGKSNLFDALRFISLLAQQDIRTAMLDLRGQPEELFRQTPAGAETSMTFAVELLLDREGTDAFGTEYFTPAQRLRYELKLGLEKGRSGTPRGVFVRREFCKPLSRAEDRSRYLSDIKLSYNSRVAPFIKIDDSSDAILVRQDGRQKHGRPMRLSLKEASRSALSTITTSEFPHLYAVRQELANIRFLEINPRAARGANNVFEDTVLKSDASNLAAVLARLKAETSTKTRPNGALVDIASDLSSLIRSVSDLNVSEDVQNRQYSFSLGFSGDLTFSSRVISDGTLRLLALLTVLNDPGRRGTLCFEEPENGVHEGRIPLLIQFLRSAAQVSRDPRIPSFQIILNTHSPKVMESLRDSEIVAADTVVDIDKSGKRRATRTRMRTGVTTQPDMFSPETELTRSEIERLLQRVTDAA
jgi:predicted ATPase